MLPVWNHLGLGRLGPVLRCFAVRAALAWMNFRPPGRQLSVETLPVFLDSNPGGVCWAWDQRPAPKCLRA